MGIRVEWKGNSGAYFLVGDDGQVHGKVLPDSYGTWEAHLDGNYLGDFWDCDSAKARVERQMRVTPYELVKDGD